MRRIEVSQPDPAEPDPMDNAVQATDRLLAMMREGREPAPEPAEPDYGAYTPEAARAALDERQKAYEDAWEIEAAKSHGKTDDVIRDELAKKGLFPNPPTEAEVATAERERLDRLNEEVAEARADIQETPRRQAPNGRTSPGIRAGLRRNRGYDHERDPSNPEQV